MKGTVTLYLIFLMLYVRVNGEKYSSKLYNDLFRDSDYNKIIIPTIKDNDTLKMMVRFLPRGISEFDEVSGKISIAMGLDLRWNDGFLKWDPSKYGNVTHLVVPEDHVWTPMLALANPIDRIPVFPEDSFPVRIYSNGMIIWIRGGTVSITCQPNVRYYPYDRHTCTAIFLTIDRIRNELVMETDLRPVILNQNEEWDIVEMKAHLCNFDAYSCSQFVITIKRRPEFSVLNICIPIICFGILNACVFLIPPESGERVSFAITVLLSFAVFMTIFTSILPKNSDPVPILSYILMFMMIESGIIVILTIVGLRIHHGQKLSNFSLNCFCKQLANCQDKVKDEQNPLNRSVLSENNEQQGEPGPRSESWSRLQFFDMVCFCISLAGFVIMVSVFAILVIVP